jgi:hypothetical protein
MIVRLAHEILVGRPAMPSSADRPAAVAVLNW